METRLYRDLVRWYHLVDPPADHLAEADCFQDAFERAASGKVETLLDLGAGAGGNAVHLKRRFRCTLADLSKDMLALSRASNPECEHIEGDMRTLRLGRTFDVVLAHDGITYMTTEADLQAAIRTAFEHTRPGGAAIFTPDGFREGFQEGADHLDGNDGTLAMQGVAWHWDPDPTDDACITDYAFLLREGHDVSVVHDRHIHGLFPRATWTRLLESTGYDVEIIERPFGDGESDEVFLCRRR
ncbi:class I SAM-dependent methyltransferase [Pendulispora albinea]|uniref:Class I SAM-dependent methyltransferase n=1 Tax=Pendulispora albinea TaxID=2741071 RepID=A0ABZ2MC98_9BACT